MQKSEWKALCYKERQLQKSEFIRETNAKKRIEGSML